MEKLEILQGFGKGKKKVKTSNDKNAIIYTRVSSKEQTENLSLEVQLKGCEQFAIRNNLQVKGRFGGTYESAQTDERNEFKRMVAFAKNYREGISIIVVYSLERFSRTGENAIWLSRELRELGITIVSVTQPIDTSNPSGVLQQNILFLFSQYDNDLRRQKCVAGMKEKLMRGYWIGCAPVGYSYDHTNPKEQHIVINKKGKYIREAFELKANEKLSNTEIADHLAKRGLKLGRKRISEVLKNPFYCGFVSHTLLEGQVVKGKHEALISEEMFFKANQVLKETKMNVAGYKHKKENQEVPLKHFVRCEQCDTPFTGYIVKKKNLHYYKCNKIGCKCNRSAKQMHKSFKEYLFKYQTKIENSDVLRDMLMEAYTQIVTQSGVNVKDVKTKAAEIREKLEKLEERFAFGEIDRGIYEKQSAKLTQELDSLSTILREAEIKLSNPENAVNHALKILQNLVNLWDSGDAKDKKELQKLLFPKGIHYNVKNDTYRTGELNDVLIVTRSLPDNSGGTKKGQKKKNLVLSGSVDPTGRLSNPIKILYALNQEVTPSI